MTEESNEIKTQSETEKKFPAVLFIGLLLALLAVLGLVFFRIWTNRQDVQPDLEFVSSEEESMVELTEWELLEQAAQTGDYDALCQLGQAYYLGEGVDRSNQKAGEYLEQAVTKNPEGSTDIMVLLGNMCMNGQLAGGNAKAMEWYEKAATYGDLESMERMGVLYYEGELLEQNSTKAAEWFQKAAEAGSVKAKKNLAYLYLTGDGVEENIGVALGLLTEADEGGEASAMASFGNFYYFGSYVEKNVETAAYWYQKAAEANDV